MAHGRWPGMAAFQIAALLFVFSISPSRPRLVRVRFGEAMVMSPVSAAGACSARNQTVPPFDFGRDLVITMPHTPALRDSCSKPLPRIIVQACLAGQGSADSVQRFRAVLLNGLPSSCLPSTQAESPAPVMTWPTSW